jgi:cell wall-associated NlpC family hydrolase
MLLGTLAVQAADGPYYIQGSEVNLRDKAWGEIIHIFDVNEKVFVIEVDGNWSYISAPVLELKGWVWNEYLGDSRLLADAASQTAGDAAPPMASIKVSSGNARVQDTTITSAEPMAVSDSAPLQSNTAPGAGTQSAAQEAVVKSFGDFIPDDSPEETFTAKVPPPGVELTNAPSIKIDPLTRPAVPPVQESPTPGEQFEAVVVQTQSAYRPAAQLPTDTELKSGFYQPYEKKQYVAPDQLRGTAFLPVGGYDIGLISATKVNVRQDPTTDGKILGKVNKRDKVFLIHEENGWYFVSIPDMELKGWISREFILELPRVEISGEQVRLREDPNMKARIKKEVDSGTVFYQFDTKHDWREVADSVSGLRGWVHEDYIKPTQKKPSRPYKVSGDAVNFRTAPGTDAEVITSFDNGTDVLVLGRTADWTYVRQGQQNGWIFSELLKPAGYGSEGTLKITDQARRSEYSTREIAKSSSPVGRELINRAIQMAGTPYVWGGDSNDGVDCSGLIYKILGRDLGCSFGDLPRTASQQFAGLGDSVSYENLEPGDMVFFSTYKEGASHVGIYLGEGDFIHASSVQHQVGYSNMEDGYYKRTFVGARRLSEAQLKALQK